MTPKQTMAHATIAAYCRSRGYPEPVAEHEFHPERRWRFDIAWPDAPIKVAIEIEGGTWAHGRHNRPAGYEADCEKYNAAVALGWRILRVTYRQLAKGLLFDCLDKLLASRAA